MFDRGCERQAALRLTAGQQHQHQHQHQHQQHACATGQGAAEPRGPAHEHRKTESKPKSRIPSLLKRSTTSCSGCLKNMGNGESGNRPTIASSAQQTLASNVIAWTFRKKHPDGEDVV